MNVLHIEDAASEAAAVQRVLSPSAGFRLHAEASLAGGVARARKGPFDVVLLDLDLPDSRGLDTVTTFRAKVPGLPIIVLCGAGEREREALRAGAWFYVPKGPGLDSLLPRAVRFAVARSAAEAALTRRP